MKKSSYRTQNQRGNFSRTKTKIHNQPTQIDSETCKREQKISRNKNKQTTEKKQSKKESKKKKRTKKEEKQKIAKTKRTKQQKQKRSKFQKLN